MRTLFFTSILGLFIISSTLSSCESPTGISGEITGENTENTKVFLIQPESLHDLAASYFGKIIDSATVDSKGNFSFMNLPKSAEPMLLEFVVQLNGELPTFLENDNPSKSNYLPLFYQNGEFINISAKLDEFQKTVSIENPSEINKDILKARDVNQKAYASFLQGKEYDVYNGDQLMAKEHAILDYQKELMNFANNTPHLIPALIALRWVSPLNDYERVPEFLVNQCKKWQELKPEHPWTQELCAQSQPSNLPVLIGSEFPNLSLPMITNDTLMLHSQLGDKLTIIDLWASWCAPCRTENREVLVPIWEKYHDQGVQIIGYSLEGNAEGWQAAVKIDGADRWLHSSELQGDNTPILNKIRVKTIPANFILNEKGVVLAKNIHGQDLINWVENYLK